MQNRSAIWVFTVLLTLACLYQISFSFVTNSFEKKAVKHGKAQAEEAWNKAIEDKVEVLRLPGAEIEIINDDANRDRIKSLIARYFENRFLEENREESVYPLLGYSYGWCKKNELNLGLDLKGGMSATLEISVPDMVKNYSKRDYRTNKVYRNAFKEAVKNTTSDNDFFTAFASATGDINLGPIFSKKSAGVEGKFKPSMSNEEVVALLREMKQDAEKNTEGIIRKRVDRMGVAQPIISRREDGKIDVQLAGVRDQKSAEAKLQAKANLGIYQIFPRERAIGEVRAAWQDVDAIISEEKFGTLKDSINQINLDNNKRQKEHKATWDKLKSAPEGFIVEMKNDSIADTLRLAEFDTLFVPQSVDTKLYASKVYPLTSLFGVKEEDQEKVKGISLPAGAIALAHVNDTATVNSYFNIAAETMPEDAELVWGRYTIDIKEKGKADKKTSYVALYALQISDNGGAYMTGDGVDKARADYDQTGSNSVVNITWNAEGLSKWESLTRATSSEEKKKSGDNYILITMDDAVYSCASVNQEISGGTEISGSFSQDEAQDLAEVIGSGSLPAKLNIVEQSVIGPSLGASNIKSGLMSFGIALAVVLLYMMFYYGKAGAIADVALVANIFFLIGCLASVKAALTLPGIAGIVLTIGMSVDANVLIFERIREELKMGKGKKLAIADGYKNAYSSIIDANITTLLTAIVLAYFGSGAIQGFATTLIIGIFTSLFSAIFITRLIFSWMLDKKKDISFSTKMTENAFSKINLPFIKKRKMFYAISACLVVASIAFVATKGLDKGVEFTGGRMYKVRFDQKADIAQLKDAFKANLVDEKNVGENVKIITSGDAYTVEITTKHMIEENTKEGDAKVNEKVTNALLSTDLGPKVQEDGTLFLATNKYAPQISAELVGESLFAIIFSLIIIFLYILLRFQKWQFGLGALTAIFHDVMIVLGLFSIFYGVLPFSMEIDQAFIAAILTVVGYSINDTVVVFDRIREYLGKHKRKSADEVVNSALNSTLSRTINTSMSTFLVLLIIFIFGAESIKGFTFALLVGVIVGTYSSLYIASPIAYDLAKDDLTLGESQKKK